MANPKILIVDDEPFNVDYLIQELDDSGYTLITAGNGQEALEKVQSESPDLVLLDIMMPVMDGFEVLSRLKAEPATREIPVIVISATNSLPSAVKGIQLGAEDYLPKPFEPVLLRARISYSLEKKRLRDLEQLYLKGLEREFEIAREIQRGFLPPELPTLEGWEIAAYFQAAREVAGDFYDAFLLSNGSLVCVIGDVCGKGVGAALFMTLFRSLLRAATTTEDLLGWADRRARSPGERLQQAVAFTNKYVAETHGEASMFATVFIGMVDGRDGRLTYLNCGHEPPLILRKGAAATPLKPTGPAVGVIPDARFAMKEAVIGKGDLLLTFTDGVPDATDPDGLSFGYERFQRLLTGDDLSPAALLQDIEAKLSRFVGSAEQFDDITLLAVKRDV